MKRTLLFVIVIGIVIAGGLTLGASAVRERDDRWTAPVGPAAKVNPLANRPEAAKGGAKLFQQRCSSCHGDDRRGSAKAPDLTQANVTAQSDGALFWKISSGNSREGMPSFSFLPELQRWQLVQWIRSER